MATTNNNSRTPEQQTAVMMKQVLTQLGYLNNTFGDVRNTLNEIAIGNAQEKDRLTDTMSKVLDSLGKLGPEIRVAMKEAKNSEDILEAFNKALHGNASSSVSGQSDVNPLLNNILTSLEQIREDNEAYTTAVMQLMQDNQTDFKATFVSFGDRITKSIEDSNQALIDNINSSEKNSLRLMGNREDRDRNMQKNFLAKLGGLLANSKPAKSAKSALKNFLDFSLLYNASKEETSEFRRKLDLIMLKAGIPELAIDAFGLAIATAFGGPILGRLLKGPASKAISGALPKIFKGSGKWAPWQKSYAQELRNARYAVKYSHGTNPMADLMYTKEKYSSMYRTAKVGDKWVTQGVKNARNAKLALNAGKVGAGGAAGGIVGLLASLVATPAAEFATDLGVDPRIAHGISGAVQGAAWGTMGGPWGIAIVGAIGLIIGIIKGNNERKAKEDAEKKKLAKDQLKVLEDIKEEKDEKKHWWQRDGKGGNGSNTPKILPGSNKQVPIRNNLDTGGFRVNTDGIDLLTVNRYLANNSNYQHLLESAGYGRLYDLRIGANGQLTDFINDSAYMNKGAINTLNQFLMSDIGKKWQNQLYVTSGTSTLYSPHTKGGDHNGGVAFDFALKPGASGTLYDLQADLTRFGARTNKAGVVQALVEGEGTPNYHVHWAPLASAIKKNAKIDMAVDDNGNIIWKDPDLEKKLNKKKAEAQSPTVAVVPTLKSSSSSILPLGNDIYSAIATNSIALVGDSPYSFS